MSRRRRIMLSAGLLALAVGVVLGVLSLLPPRHGVTKANLDRVQIGMNEHEVKAIFDGEPSILSHLMTRSHRPVRSYRASWDGPDGCSVTITFSDDVVHTKEWHPSTETFLAKLPRWLHAPE